MFIDDVLVIDEWHDSSADELYRYRVSLEGEHQITVQYYERRHFARIEVDWKKVAELNQEPVAEDDSYSTEEDIELIVEASGLLSNDSDPEEEGLVAELVDSPSSGTLVLNSDGSFSYLPNSDFNGTDSFSYRASDGEISSKVATVVISVSPVNDAPEAQADSYSVVAGELLEVEAPGLLENDSDQESSVLITLLETDVSSGLLTLAEDGSFTYLPDAGFEGIETFSYRASDGEAVSTAVDVVIEVTKPVEEPSPE
jgi:hypothetical protein